jgi:hypothetical protein
MRVALDDISYAIEAMGARRQALAGYLPPRDAALCISEGDQGEALIRDLLDADPAALLAAVVTIVNERRNNYGDLS